MHSSELPHPTPVPWGRWLLITMIATVAAHALDPVAWQHLRHPKVNDTDWGRMLRTLGYLPFWVVLAAAMRLQTSEVGLRRFRAQLLVFAPLAGGLTAELLKLGIRRLRPDPDQFGYVFRSVTEGPLSNRGMGMPSSHVLVAFAGATALGILFPRLRGLALVLAAGCALTRVLALGHFLSDTVVAACLGWAVAHLVTGVLARRST